MGKTGDIKELTTLLSLALTHKIGSQVNPNEIYTEKYKKESEEFVKEAEKISLRQNWNSYDKNNIKNILRKKLRSKLTTRDFLNNKKFDLMDTEIKNILKRLGLQ